VEPEQGERLWVRGGICPLTSTEGGSWMVSFLLVPLQVTVPFEISAGPSEQQLCRVSVDPVCFTGRHLIERQKGKVRRARCILGTLPPLPWKRKAAQ